MSHILLVQLDYPTQQRLDAGEYVLPEHVDDRVYLIECPDGCDGWQTCLEKHEGQHVDVILPADQGPDDCQQCTEPPLLHTAWCGQEEFEFHGVIHTWRYGHGWTVPYPGCVVAATPWDSDFDRDDVPRGRYEVQEDWDDESCWLEFTTTPPTEPIW